ncbi:MAG: DUF481 domain-containing protein [Phycisphaerales bacterium]
MIAPPPLAAFVAAIFSQIASPAVPHSDEPHTVTLTTGEVLRGSASTIDADHIRLVHPILGELTIPIERVRSIEPALAQPEPQPTESLSTPPEPAADEPAAESPAPSFWDEWTRSVSAGFNASDGNANAINGRLALEAARDTPLLRTTVGGAYVYAQDAGGVRKARLDAGARNDWRLKHSRWRVFATAAAEYDQFADWDWRITTTAGLGYAVVKTEHAEVVLRAGPGLSREFGGEDDTIAPIAVVGADFNWKLSPQSSLAASFDVLPDLAKPSDFRTISKAGYEVLLDHETNLLLKVGGSHRHDSDPGGAEPNDFEFFVALGLRY